MKNKKRIVIGTLCALIMIMAVGYALLSQQLTINGTANITSNWQVEITNITEKEKSTGATTNSTNYTATTASFDVGLTSPGDYAIYEVTITNKGTIDAVLASDPIITLNRRHTIIYETSGIKKGDKLLKNNGTNKVTIKVEYDPAATIQQVKEGYNIELTLNYEQDLGQALPNDYEIGDKITFAGNDWYVIKNSGNDEDYVTVMKETVLTHNELGSYAYNATSNKMEYSWSEGCHNANHGYSTNTSGNCENLGLYENSKVREFLEGTYLNTLGTENLKEIDGYKIRLVKLEELKANLGYGNYAQAQKYVPTWVYQNLGVEEDGYWTMTKSTDPEDDENKYVMTVANHDGTILDYYLLSPKLVRPVINLLKTSIE